MENIRVLLIIPAYNEEENILNTYNDVIKYNKESHEKSGLYRDRLLSAIEFFHNTEDILHGLRIKLSCLCNEFL